MPFGVLGLILQEEPLADIVLREPVAGVVLDGVAPERGLVGKGGGVAAGLEGEERGDERGRADDRDAPLRGHAGVDGIERGDGEADGPDYGKVEKVIHDPAEGHVGSGDEADERRKEEDECAEAEDRRRAPA